MLLRTFAVITLAVAALLPQISSAEMLPGKHPGYLHALSDLRSAKWKLYHQEGDSKVYGYEDESIREIDAAIGELKHAAHDDGKDLLDHPAVDTEEHGSRLLKAIENLKQAHRDIASEEDNPEVRELRNRALEHVDHALHAAGKAHSEWLKDKRS